MAPDERGIYAASPAEASVQRRLMEAAKEVGVVATSALPDKLGAWSRRSTQPCDTGD